MVRTRVLGVGSALLLSLFIVQDAVIWISAYMVDESKSPSFRTDFAIYILCLCVLFAVLSARIYVLLTSRHRPYTANVMSSTVAFGLMVAFLYEYMPRPDDHTICDSEGKCFTLYDISAPRYLFPAALLYIVLGVLRACVTYVVAILISNRKLK